jgi:hypothetical protein
MLSTPGRYPFSHVERTPRGAFKPKYVLLGTPFNLDRTLLRGSQLGDTGLLNSLFKADKAIPIPPQIEDVCAAMEEIKLKYPTLHDEFLYIMSSLQSYESSDFDCHLLWMKTAVEYVLQTRDGRELYCLFDVESRLHNVLKWTEFEFGSDSAFFITLEAWIIHVNRVLDGLEMNLVGILH